MRRYARVLTGEASRADDLVQDTLARRLGRSARSGRQDRSSRIGCSR